MSFTDLLPVLVRLVFSFFAAFGAIAVWSKSREASWVFIVTGAIFYLVDSLHSVLVIIGINYELPFFPDIPILESVLAGLPPFFLAVGFLAFLIRNRRY